MYLSQSHQIWLGELVNFNQFLLFSNYNFLYDKFQSTIEKIFESNQIGIDIHMGILLDKTLQIELLGSIAEYCKIVTNHESIGD